MVAVSIKVLGGKLASKLVYFVQRKELLNFTETAPWTPRVWLILIMQKAMWGEKLVQGSYEWSLLGIEPQKLLLTGSGTLIK